jgi:hypothetical protein
MPSSSVNLLERVFTDQAAHLTYLRWQAFRGFLSIDGLHHARRIADLAATNPDDLPAGLRAPELFASGTDWMSDEGRAEAAWLAEQFRHELVAAQRDAA